MAIRQANYGKKIVLLSLLIIFLLILSILILDFVSSYFGYYLPIPLVKDIKKATFAKKLKESENPYLLEREELSKDQERLSLIEEQLIVRSKELELKEGDLNKKIETVKEKEGELEKKSQLLEDSQNKYKDKQKNIREQAVKLYNMPPVDAVSLLEKQSESDVVDILRAIDAYSEELGRSSTSSYLMKLLGDMNKEKAAVVLRMLKHPTGDSDTGVEILNESELEIPPVP